MFAVIGHVDTGKSTLCGRILVETNLDGSNEELTRTINSLTNKADGTTRYSELMDLYEEERLKSKTIECASAVISHAGRDYTMIDTPGHKKYITAMIDGISATDTAVLVVSAIENEFMASLNGGQTLEDLIIAKGSGIRKLIVALNKVDHPNRMPPESMMCSVRALCSFLNFKKITFVQTSGTAGIGITELLDAVAKNCGSRRRVVPGGTPKCIFVGEFILLVDKMICSGTELIGHCKGREFNCEFKVNGFSTKRHTKFICKIKTSQPVDSTPGRSIIMRDCENTIGIFIIKK